MSNENDKPGWLKKLKDFNQIIFALAGIGIALMLLIGGIIWVASLASDLFPDSKYKRPGNQILSDKELSKLPDDSLRTQILTFREPIQIDTIRNIYIIPVSQKETKQKERTFFGSGSDSYSSSQGSDYTSYYYSYSYRSYGRANNLIYYDPVNDIKRPIFDRRVAINRWEVAQADSSVHVLMYCTTTDTDSDGVYSDDDIEVLFAFTTDNTELRKLEIPQHTIIDAKLERPTNDLIIEVGFDRDNNGKYEYRTEPKLLKKCDSEFSTVKDLVDKSMMAELQDLFDGKVKK